MAVDVAACVAVEVRVAVAVGVRADVADEVGVTEGLALAGRVGVEAMVFATAVRVEVPVTVGVPVEAVGELGAALATELGSVSPIAARASASTQMMRGMT